MSEDFVASPGSPRIWELIEDQPGKNNRDRPGGDNSVFAWPEVNDWLKVAGQPVPGPWPPHQESRPDPEVASAEAVAVAEPEQELRDIARKRGDAPAEGGIARWRQGGDSGPDYGSAASSPGGYGKPQMTATDVAKKHHAATGSTGIWNDTASVWKGGSLKDLNPDEGE